MDTNKIGVITFDEEKVKSFMTNISIEHKDRVIRFMKLDCIWELLLSNDNHYVWVQPWISSIQPPIFKKVYIDKDIEINILEEIVLCIHNYCGKIDIERF